MVSFGKYINFSKKSSWRWAAYVTNLEIFYIFFVFILLKWYWWYIQKTRYVLYINKSEERIAVKIKKIKTTWILIIITVYKTFSSFIYCSRLRSVLFGFIWIFLNNNNNNNNDDQIKTKIFRYLSFIFSLYY